VTEPSVNGAKVPAAAAGARRSSIRGMESELASPVARDRQSPCPGGGTTAASAQTLRASRAQGAGGSKAATQDLRSWDSKDSGPGCSPVPGRREQLLDPHAEQGPKGYGDMSQKGLQSRVGLTAVLSPFPSPACDSAPRQPGCAQRRC